MLILRSDSLNSYGIFQPAERQRQIKKTEHKFDITIKTPGEDKTHLGQDIPVFIMSLTIFFFLKSETRLPYTFNDLTKTF